MEKRIPDIQPGIIFLEIYQVAGGIIGALLTISLLKNLITATGVTMLILFLAIALYAYSIFCGVLLFWNKKKGLAHSRINQLLQVFSFAMVGYAFQYVSGLFFTLGLDLTKSVELKFNFGLSSWQININSDSPDLLINFNLIAVLLAVIVEKLIRRIKLKEDIEAVSALGDPKNVI